MSEDAPTKQRTILVVDDDALLCRALERVLQTKGYQVLAATDGTLAIEMSRSCMEPIDLVLVDLMMPIQHGFSLVDILVHERPEAKIVLTSGAIREHMLLERDRERVHGFLAKPFTSSHLLQLIKRLLHAV